MERRVFPLDPVQRLVRLLIGAFWIFTGVLAWLALVPWGTAVFGKVVLDEERVAKRPWGGSIRYDRVRRWGQGTVSFRQKTSDYTSRRVTRQYVVVQSTGGWRIRIRYGHYRDGEALLEALGSRLGEPTAMRQSWFRGLRFVD